MIQSKVGAAALVAVCGRIDDECGAVDEVSKFEKIGSDLEVPVKFLHFVFEIPQSGRRALQALAGADNTHIVPHEAPNLIPIVVNDHEFVDIGDISAFPSGEVVFPGGADTVRDGKLLQEIAKRPV